MRTIKVISGATAGEERQVEGDVVLGRENADLVLPDPEVSRRHAVVRPAERGVEIEDLGSRNGTFVDERRLEQPTTLVQTAAVRLGTTRLALEIALAPEVTAPHGVIAEPDVTVQREAIPQPDVTAKRAIPQPDVTAKRAIPQPDVTAKRAVPSPPAPAETAQGAPDSPRAEAKLPQSPRQLLPLVLGGLAAAITVAVTLALLLG